MHFFTRSIAAATISLAALGVQAEALSIEGGGAASLTGILPQSMAPYVAKEGINLQVVTGQSLTKSVMKVALGRLDLSVAPPPALNAMKKGVGPYKRNAEKAQKVASNIRTLFGFVASGMHPIVWADSDIKSWKDIKGKRVFLGPPAGAAAGQSTGMIELASGYKAGKDFEGVKLPWGAATQGFQDGQFDVYVGFYPVGSQTLNELSLQRSIRILPISDEIIQSPEWTAYTDSQVTGVINIPANTYSGVVNGDQDIKTASTLMTIITNKDLSDELAYKITKSFWENLPEMKKANSLMMPIDPDHPFTGVNTPLHPGAIRYYQEAGFTIPEQLK